MDLSEILATNNTPEGLSVGELLEKLGWPDSDFYRDKIRKKLKLEMAAGRAEYAGDKQVTRIDGRPTRVPVYRAKG